MIALKRPKKINLSDGALQCLGVRCANLDHLQHEGVTAAIDEAYRLLASVVQRLRLCNAEEGAGFIYERLCDCHLATVGRIALQTAHISSGVQSFVRKALEEPLEVDALNDKALARHSG